MIYKFSIVVMDRKLNRVLANKTFDINTSDNPLFTVKKGDEIDCEIDGKIVPCIVKNRVDTEGVAFAVTYIHFFLIEKV